MIINLRLRRPRRPGSTEAGFQSPLTTTEHLSTPYRWLVLNGADALTPSRRPAMRVASVTLKRAYWPIYRLLGCRAREGEIAGGNLPGWIPWRVPWPWFRGREWDRTRRPSAQADGLRRKPDEIRSCDPPGRVW